MKTKHIQHLYWRAGFGLDPKSIDKLKNQNKKQIVGDLFSKSKSSTPLKIDTSELQEYAMSMTAGSKNNFKEFGQKSRLKIFELNEAWINRLMQPSELLRERMTLFWANHFVCRDNNVILIERYNNTLRENAFGDFGDFVKAISKEASMIKYLNNKQNIKTSPNENFGRELLELFTLGVGNYSENDIKGAARAFTGWNSKRNGEFVLRKNNHDFGLKEFMGQEGKFGGNDIIDIILQQRQCAKFICAKIYGDFVNEKLNDAHIEEMASVFYKDYNIKNLMRFVFMSDWFYDEVNIGTKIKSPIELIVGINNIVPIHFEGKRGSYYFQSILGQILLRPPNVAGWKGGKSWIDSNTMMVRLKLPSVLLNNAVIALEEKGELEDSYEMYYERMNKRKKFMKTNPDWALFEDEFKDVSTKKMVDILISHPLSTGAENLINHLEINDKRDYCVQLMSIPEYQMC